MQCDIWHLPILPIFTHFTHFTHFCHFAICRIRWQACGDSRVGFEVRSWGSEVRFEGRGVSKKPCQSRVSRWVCLPHSMYVVYIHCIYSVYILCICMVQGVRCDSRGGVFPRTPANSGCLVGNVCHICRNGKNCRNGRNCKNVSNG